MVANRIDRSNRDRTCRRVLPTDLRIVFLRVLAPSRATNQLPSPIDRTIKRQKTSLLGSQMRSFPSAAGRPKKPNDWLSWITAHRQSQIDKTKGPLLCVRRRNKTGRLATNPLSLGRHSSWAPECSFGWRLVRGAAVWLNGPLFLRSTQGAIERICAERGASFLLDSRRYFQKVLAAKTRLPGIAVVLHQFYHWAGQCRLLARWFDLIEKGLGGQRIGRDRKAQAFQGVG